MQEASSSEYRRINLPLREGHTPLLKKALIHALWRYYVEPIKIAKSEAHAVRVVSVVVVDVAIVVDVEEVVGIVNVRRTEPPVVSGATNTMFTAYNL